MAARALLIVALLLVPPSLLGGCRDAPAADGRETVTIRGETFRLEVAADDATRELGLMNRTSIPDHGGMLFVFPDADFRSFWMAYCLVDMDVIFLDPKGRITAAHRMKALPPKRDDESVLEYESRMHEAADSYWSVYPAQFAIELKAGTVDRLGLRVEEVIPLDLPRLKAMAR